MAASLQLSVRTGSGAGAFTDGVSGVDMISADNALNSLANRQANPITVGGYSYEKWLALKVVTAPANSTSGFKIWGDGAVAASSTLWFTGNYATYQQGTTAASTIANTSFTNFTSGNKANWDTGTYSMTGSYTKYSVWQLQIGADSNPGNWTTETVSYSFDET
jgi:hypothetical protein